MFAISESMLQCAPRPMLAIDRNWKPNAELAPNCPRCASANTKFCYYNNYSLSQPRYFCKGCRRYWTKGGSLRNVPVGGGCRKSRRGKSNRVDKNGAQISTNYGKNLTSFGTHQEHMMGTTTSHGDTGNQPGPATTTGSDIDLAVIFAQFLNQSTSSDQPEIILAQEWPNEGMEPWSCLEQDTNSQNNSSMELPVVHTIPESYNTLQEMPQVEQHLKDNSVEELLESDEINAFGLQNLLADEMVQDVFWSNYAANTPSFECQLQQLESFPVDDQLKISANLMAETWTSFDLSGSELLSKP